MSQAEFPQSSEGNITRSASRKMNRLQCLVNDFASGRKLTEAFQSENTLLNYKQLIRQNVSLEHLLSLVGHNEYHTVFENDLEFTTNEQDIELFEQVQQEEKNFIASFTKFMAYKSLLFNFDDDDDSEPNFSEKDVEAEFERLLDDPVDSDEDYDVDIDNSLGRKYKEDFEKSKHSLQEFLKNYRLRTIYQSILKSLIAQRVVLYKKPLPSAQTIDTSLSFKSDYKNAWIHDTRCFASYFILLLTKEHQLEIFEQSFMIINQDHKRLFTAPKTQIPLNKLHFIQPPLSSRRYNNRLILLTHWEDQGDDLIIRCTFLSLTKSIDLDRLNERLLLDKTNNDLPLLCHTLDSYIFVLYKTFNNKFKIVKYSLDIDWDLFDIIDIEHSLEVLIEVQFLCMQLIGTNLNILTRDNGILQSYSVDISSSSKELIYLGHKLKCESPSECFTLADNVISLRRYFHPSSFILRNPTLLWDRTVQILMNKFIVVREENLGSGYYIFKIQDLCAVESKLTDNFATNILILLPVALSESGMGLIRNDECSTDEVIRTSCSWSKFIGTGGSWLSYFILSHEKTKLGIESVDKLLLPVTMIRKVDAQIKEKRDEMKDELSEEEFGFADDEDD